jgi:uncharacterized membrane protein YdjX (TVP38/TMEM64 family)
MDEIRFCREESMLPTMEANTRVDENGSVDAGRRNDSSRWRWFLLAAILLAVAGFYALGLQQYFSWEYVRDHLDFWQRQVQRHLFLVLVVYFVIYVAVTALSLPVASVISLVAGWLFGRWLGTGVVSLASTVGAVFAFLSSRFLFRDAVEHRFAGRLQGLNQGVERDGGYYLFTLRLVPIFPFFLVNLGMGLTRMHVWQYTWVSWLGMLPGTFLYVNAGQALSAIDSPSDILSPGVLISFALLGIAPLAFRKLVQWKIRARTLGMTLGVLLLAGSAAIAVRTHFRYRAAPVMEVPVKECNNLVYPEDPSIRSIHFGQYNNRTLTLVQKDETHFDFIFEPRHGHIARVVFRDVDVSLMTPSIPVWTRNDTGLTRIALTDRQWNRQQVRFEPNSAQVEISGGDGFEKKNMISAELAKNCLNAGLWEVMLYVKENGAKTIYYHDWFTFPLGHYKSIFERSTTLPYWRHWYYLEHWFDPAGTPINLDGLRKVQTEENVGAQLDPDEPVLVAGEQVTKRRTTIAENVRAWKDFYDGRKIRFAQFIPPGKYSMKHLWKNEYWRLASLERAVSRTIISPATSQPLRELELVFKSKHGERTRFLVSGLNGTALPSLSKGDYDKGIYMPMGIGVPPFFQTYEDLRRSPPDKSPYFSLMLDEAGRWINHHDVAVDGPVLHRDPRDPELIHLYLLSYERHTLIGHWIIQACWK